MEHEFPRVLPPALLRHKANQLQDSELSAFGTIKVQARVLLMKGRTGKKMKKGTSPSPAGNSNSLESRVDCLC